MAFFSILAAIAIEHVRPQRVLAPHYLAYARYTERLRARFDGGEVSHGALAWAVAVLPVLFVVWLIGAALNGISPALAWLWNISVLYFTMGFKYFSDDAEAIARLLRAGDLDAARQRLAVWRVYDPTPASVEPASDEIARLSIEHVFAASLRQMFGVLFWFVLLSPLGPVGAVLYRTASILARRWQTGSAFGTFARRVFHLVNWLPARLVALTYAVAGDFEDAMYCWRTQADAWPQTEDGVVLAAGAGAMGVRLGQPLGIDDDGSVRSELGLNQPPDADQIDSAISMVWRGLVIWLVVGVLLVVAGWAG
jgi:adenosylcobinamide-phosphate synthase